MEITSQSKIQLLPEHIIDQIKAGEVIERPSTLIKEIIENSIDAKSTKIDLHLVENGLDLININDNGVGINDEDLPLAFCRHATSKIDRFEDIYKLHSYGFRGEALASIASISKVTCESQTIEKLGLIKIEGGQTITHQTEARPSNKTGTKFFIRDLFYNTPVRMKFIQSKTSEKNQLKKMINSFLLTHPEIEFSIKWDENEKEYFPKRGNIKDRIKDVLFSKKDISFFESQNTYDGINFKIILTHQSTRGNAHKSNFLFINDRYVQDFQIHKIILNSASPLWPEGESGHYIAFLDIPTDEIDVNIHPNKTVVKLFKAPKIYSIVSGTIKHSLSEVKSNRPAPKSHDENELPLENISPSFKTMDYKQVDFSQEETINTYFSDLHSTTQRIDEKPVKIIYGDKNISMYMFQDAPYLLNKNELLLKELDQLLKNEDLISDIIPLLVSRPIKIDKKLSTAQFDLFSSLGFELDQLDKSTLVIRSFPKGLQRFPYLKIVNFLIFKKVTHKNDIDLADFELEEINENHIIDLIEKYTIPKLISQKIIIKILPQDLINLYEKKK